MATNPREIQLSPEQQTQLASLSDQAGISWPDLLSQLFASCPPTAKLAGNRHATLYDALADDGFLGAAVGGPSDMSTNPIYLEGLGADR
jgi:hypothetical protein